MQKKNNFCLLKVFVPMSATLNAVGTCRSLKVVSAVFSCIHKSFPAKCLTLPDPCLLANCLAELESVNWTCSKGSSKTNVAHALMNIPSQTQLTKLCNSLSHGLSDMTLWLLLLAYMKHSLMKCTPHDVERRVDLFALQSASLKLSNIHLHSPPALSFPCPSWGNCKCKPMSPTAFMNPTILRNLASEVNVGALMHDASSFMVYIRSGLSRPTYRHSPTIERYAFESFSESLCELSGNWMLASQGTFCCRACPKAFSNEQTTLSTVVPGAKIIPSSTSRVFLLRKLMLDPAPVSSSWLTENLSFTFFRNTSFQKDFNPT